MPEKAAAGNEERGEAAPQVLRLQSRSLWVLHFNTGACNGCDIEVLAAFSPRYDPERLGVRLAPSPRHADVILVTGALTRKSAEALRRLYEQMPGPKYVVAVGTCAVSGGVFRGSYSVLGGADKAVPVDIYIPGCPPRPEVIVEALARLAEKLRLEARRREEGDIDASA